MRSRWTGLFCLLMLADTSWGTEQIQAGSVPRFTLDGMQAFERDCVLEIINNPTLHARGPGQTFRCRPDYYHWFLEHPDRAVVAWRRLGARCVSIVPRGENSFAWKDAIGSEVVWSTVQRSPGQRIWFAEGKVKPGPLLPSVPVKAVVVLCYTENKVLDGTAVITQQAFLYVHTDSKSAALVTKLLGSSSQRIAEQGMDQLQIFFSGLSGYLHRHPEHAEPLLKE